MSDERKKWLAERRKGCGGSDIAAILGIDPFRTAYDVWADKVYGADVVEFESPDFSRGKLLEPAICAYYEKESGDKVIDTKNNIFIHPQISYARVTPDRFVNSNGILEAKSSRFRVYKEDLNKSWFAQATYVAGVAKKTQVAIAWLGGMDFGYTTFELDNEFFEFMLAKVIDFWNRHVLKKIPPAPQRLSDVKKLYAKAIKGKIIVADKKLRAAHEELVLVKELLGGLTDQREILEEKIKMKMLDCEALVSGNKILATWRNPEDKKVEFDVERFAKKHPQIYKRFLKKVDGSRRFYIKDNPL